VRPTATREECLAALFADEKREARIRRRAWQVILACIALLVATLCPAALPLLALPLLRRR
jgi:hypothetical protein